MEKAKRVLKSISIFIIVLGVISLISTIIAVVSPTGAYNVEAVIALNGLAPEEANAITVTTIVFGIVGFLLELLVGLKGIIVANGGKKSAIVTIIVVITIILLVIGASGSIGLIVRGQTDILGSQIIIQVCELLLFIFYIIETNKVIALRKTNV